MNIKVTNKEEYEKALILLKELRNKIFNIVVKTSMEPMYEIEKRNLEKEVLKLKKARTELLIEIIKYEKANNIERRKKK